MLRPSSVEMRGVYALTVQKTAMPDTDSPPPVYGFKKTVLPLEKGAWSMVKSPRQATNEYVPSPRPRPTAYGLLQTPATHNDIPPRPPLSPLLLILGVPCCAAA